MDEIINKIVEAVSEGILQKIKENWGDVKSSRNEKEENEVFSITDVCNRLKISKPTLSRHIKLGYLKPSFYVGRSPRFTQSTIEEYISKFNEAKEV